VLYEDANGNGAPDPDEAPRPLSLIPSGAEAHLRGFLRYGLMLLSGPAELKEVQDSPSGAEDYYRYDLSLPAGWSLIESELASNGYDARAAEGSDFDLYVAQNPGGAPAPSVGR
jgi:hypothetical protein